MSRYYDYDDAYDYSDPDDEPEPQECNECGAPHYGEHDPRCPFAPRPKTFLQCLRGAWLDRFYYRRILVPSIYDLDMKLRRTWRNLFRSPPSTDDDIPF